MASRSIRPRRARLSKTEVLRVMDAAITAVFSRYTGETDPGKLARMDAQSKLSGLRVLATVAGYPSIARWTARVLSLYARVAMLPATEPGKGAL